MRHLIAIATVLALAGITLTSCTQDYICVCEAPAEDTVLRETTNYPGLRKSEAEIEEENCESRSACRWLEDK